MYSHHRHWENFIY